MVPHRKHRSLQGTQSSRQDERDARKNTKKKASKEAQRDQREARTHKEDVTQSTKTSRIYVRFTQQRSKHRTASLGTTANCTVLNETEHKRLTQRSTPKIKKYSKRKERKAVNGEGKQPLEALVIYDINSC